jgi:hypothetical protein
MIHSLVPSYSALEFAIGSPTIREGEWHSYSIFCKLLVVIAFLSVTSQFVSAKESRSTECWEKLRVLRIFLYLGCLSPLVIFGCSIAFNLLAMMMGIYGAYRSLSRRRDISAGTQFMVGRALLYEVASISICWSISSVVSSSLWFS